jgi:fatty acid/phospholipid biosynthesis enzyme
MANRTIAVHTSESNIAEMDKMAKALRRSRNSVMNEGIEMVLESWYAAKLKDASTTPNKKKAGAR